MLVEFGEKLRVLITRSTASDSGCGRLRNLQRRSHEARSDKSHLKGYRISVCTAVLRPSDFVLFVSRAKPPQILPVGGRFGGNRCYESSLGIEAMLEFSA